MWRGQRYGVDLPRATTDADLIVDARTFGRDSMRRVAAQLEELRFAVEANPDGVTRYVRDNAKVDLLAPDGLGGEPIETSRPGRAVMAPGAAPDAPVRGGAGQGLRSPRVRPRRPDCLILRLRSARRP